MTRPPPLAIAVAVATVVGVLVSFGCQALPLEDLAAPTPRGEGVSIQGTARWSGGGRAAVIGPDVVLTVAHVLAGQTEAWVATSRSGGGLVPARVIRELPAHPEAVLVVRLTTHDGLLGLIGFGGFPADRQFVAGTGPAVTVETARGREPLLSARLEPGDSGSPILDAGGGLVGLLSGRLHGAPVFVPLTPADLTPDMLRPVPPVGLDLVARAWGRVVPGAVPW